MLNARRIVFTVKRLAALTAAAVILTCAASGSFNVTAAPEITPVGSDTVYVSLDGYDGYREQFKDAASGGQAIRVQAEDFSAPSDKIETLTDIPSAEGSCVLAPGDGSISFTVPVQSAGMYNIRLRYYSKGGKGYDIERALSIDGKIPFKECAALMFKRAWTQEVSGGEFKIDSQKNDIKPAQTQAERWEEQAISDPLGYYAEPFLFYFSEGEHVITLKSIRESVILDWIELCPPEQLQKYAEVYKGYADKTNASAEPITVQAEKPSGFSDLTISPLHDISSPRTVPQSPSSTHLNTIGRDKWQQNGQWISWDFDVKKPGLYKIALRFKQNGIDGMFVNRRLYIDGSIPFDEAQAIRFPYGSNWQHSSLGDQNGDFLFYFDEGPHEIKLEVVLGEFSELLRTVQQVVVDLNADYREIRMITGEESDKNRDYNFKSQIPEVVEDLGRNASVLRDVAEKLTNLASSDGEQVALLNKVAHMLQAMHDKPSSIAGAMSSSGGYFNTNISALGTWMLDNSNRPLELDYITLCSPEHKLSKAESGFFGKLMFDIKKLFYSFFTDTDAIGTVTDTENLNPEDSITVWITGGRDQAVAIRSLIDNDFIANKSIPVKFELVAAGTLLPSVLAGVGPDVSMSNEGSEPVNFAVRGAAANLKQFSDFDEIAKRFFPSSLTGFTYNDSVYALPETQSFPMLFYREDIFAEMGLEPPKTWNEFYALLREIQKQNMEVGIQTPQLAYTMMLSQHDSQLYRDNGLKTNLDSIVGMNCFTEVSDMYTQYRLPLVFDFSNRFRRGDMPAAIMDYTSFNQLSVFAPEIRGLWSFIPVPGVLNDDGSINNTVPVACTGIMMLNNGKGNKANAWEYIKWWTSEETQSKYGRELESIMGTAARYNTANIAALNSMPWTANEYSSLMLQAQKSIGLPVYPGSYMTDRALDFAFKETYNKNTDPLEALAAYTDSINVELERKREEFLDVK